MASNDMWMVPTYLELGVAKAEWRLLHPRTLQLRGRARAHGILIASFAHREAMRAAITCMGKGEGGELVRLSLG